MIAAPTLNNRLICPMLVGREGELATLRRLLEAVSASRGGTALIAGEAGIGKSRLVAEVRSYAADGGFLVLEGACFPQDKATPYAPLLDLLRSRFAGLPAEAVAAAVGPFTAEVALLLPELGLTPAATAAVVGDQGLERRRLFAALTHCLTTPAQDQPVLVIIEDLHWCDDASLDLLFGLARQAAALPLLLLATYRDDEVEGRLRGWLMQLTRERLFTELHLTPLNSEEVSTMVRAIAGPVRPVPAEVVDALHARADGNPLSVEELLKSSLAGGASGTDTHACPPDLPAGRRVPRSLQMAVLQRVERLSADAAEVLRRSCASWSRRTSWWRKAATASCSDTRSRVRRCTPVCSRASASSCTALSRRPPSDSMDPSLNSGSATSPSTSSRQSVGRRRWRTGASPASAPAGCTPHAPPSSS